MKRSILLLSLFFLFGCHEIGVEINPQDGPPGPTPPPDVGEQKRQVLMEEFTGVRCVFCPAGSAEIENLLAIHNERLVAVSIHAGGLAPPLTESNYDFRTDEGDKLLDLFGEPLGYPAAIVNRKKFEGELDLHLSKGEWPGAIGLELEGEPSIKIGLQPSYDEATRQIDLDVFLFPQEDIVAEDVRLSVMITESGVVDAQDTLEEGIVENYTHKHILRDMMTNWDGNPLATPMIANTEIRESFSFQLPQEWDSNQCELIVFVAQGGDNVEVYQAAKVKI